MQARCMPARIETLLLNAALVGCTLITVAGCNKAADSESASLAHAMAGSNVDDSLVTSRIKSSLQADPDTKSFYLKVDTLKGEVTLSGSVDTKAQMDKAVNIARNTEGVRLISNEMSVKQ